ncbi:MAG: FtsX-like permease family protein [Gemmatimonadales bacterium]
MSETRRRSVASLTTAWWGLRTYRGTAALLVLVAGVAFAAALPAVSFGGWRSSSLHATSSIDALGAAGGRFARSPAWLRLEALRLLLVTFACVSLAAFVAGALGTLLLFASRAGERAGETAVRRAVGAARRTLLGAAVLEGAGISLGALAVGVPLGLLSTSAAQTGWLGRPGTGWALVLLAFATASMVLVGALLAFVFAPRRRLSDAEPRPLGLVAPVIQLGFALIALTCGSLIAHGAAGQGWLRGHASAGEVVRANVPQTDQRARSRAYLALLRTIRTGARYDTVSLSGQGSVVGLGTVGMITTQCGRCAYGGLAVPQHSVAAAQQYVSADSFQAFGVHLVAGRGISDADDWQAPRVAVVSRGLAQQHFEHGEPLGRRLQLSDDPRTWYTVVGVVDDQPVTGLGGALLPPFTVYASVLQHPPGAVEVLVRSRRGPTRSDSALPALVAKTLGVDRRGVVGRTEAAVWADDRAPIAWFGRWFSVEGWITLFLAAVGTVAQMRLWVGSLAPELGLRRALGASRARTLALVLGRAARVGLAGTALGLCVGPAIWGALGTMVRDLPAWDPGVVLDYSVVLVTTTVLAAAGPVWSAVRTAPARLLTAA